MRRARPAFVAPTILGLLAVCTGCYRPMQTPYGAYGNPYGYPGAPVQTLQPGTPYTPTPAGVPSGSIDPTGGNAPFYGNGSSSKPPYDGGGVPTYNDAVQFNTGNDFQKPIHPDQTAVDEFGAIQTVDSEASGAARVNLETAEFVSPVIEGAAPAIPQLPEGAGSPFAHDAQYRWLRGLLRYDADVGGWTMIYSDHPGVGDEHGGQVVVADSPALESFKPQSVVLLRGEIDSEQSSTAGRAVYRAEVVEPVELAGP